MGCGYIMTDSIFITGVVQIQSTCVNKHGDSKGLFGLPGSGCSADPHAIKYVYKSLLILEKIYSKAALNNLTLTSRCGRVLSQLARQKRSIVIACSNQILLLCSLKSFVVSIPPYPSHSHSHINFCFCKEHLTADVGQ